MRATPPTRLPEDVYEAAVTQAAADSRTVPQQVAHWARIGRELERSPQVNHRAVQDVLVGRWSYDDLGEREQALVRGSWAEQIATRRRSLDYEADFALSGEAYSEADDTGAVVRRSSEP